ncbi:hypothetical protein [Nocardia asteroides]|uniref:hypothetical protein n=1 Tax=Nocardia asteroides TaxID=1824 RepID=UPI001E5C0274|nr:hypothetical protein [Nocardia asteroides]UGT52459.1 hypothetical protein LTT85_17100 [Nocardia asteroides]
MKYFGSAALLALVGIIVANLWPVAGIAVLAVAIGLAVAGAVRIRREDKLVTARKSDRRWWASGGAASGGGGFIYYGGGDSGSDGGGGGGCGGGGGGCGGGS